VITHSRPASRQEASASKDHRNPAISGMPKDSPHNDGPDVMWHGFAAAYIVTGTGPYRSAVVSSVPALTPLSSLHGPLMPDRNDELPHNEFPTGSYMPAMCHTAAARRQRRDSSVLGPPGYLRGTWSAMGRGRATECAPASEHANL